MFLVLGLSFTVIGYCAGSTRPEKYFIKETQEETQEEIEEKIVSEETEEN